MDTIYKQLDLNNKYYKVSDGWFTYYVNVKTGHKKFELEPSDVLVEHKFDFIEEYYNEVC